MTPAKQHHPATLQRCIKRLKAIVQALLDDDKPRHLTTTTTTPP